MYETKNSPKSTKFNKPNRYCIFFRMKIGIISNIFRNKKSSENSCFRSHHFNFILLRENGLQFLYLCNTKILFFEEKIIFFTCYLYIK